MLIRSLPGLSESLDRSSGGTSFGVLEFLRRGRGARGEGAHGGGIRGVLGKQPLECGTVCFVKTLPFREDDLGFALGWTIQRPGDSIEPRRPTEPSRMPH